MHGQNHIKFVVSSSLIILFLPYIYLNCNVAVAYKRDSVNKQHSNPGNTEGEFLSPIYDPTYNI